MIVCLHDIAENPVNEWQITPRELKEIAENKEITELHFDDGRAGVLKFAPYILKPYMDRIKVTLFLVPNWINIGAPVHERYSKFLTWSQARTLYELGFEIGSHTLNHPDLRTLPDGALYSELKESKDTITQFLGIEPKRIAYPYGLFNETVKIAASRHYSYGFALRSNDLSNFEISRRIYIHKI